MKLMMMIMEQWSEWMKPNIKLKSFAIFETPFWKCFKRWFWPFCSLHTLTVSVYLFINLSQEKKWWNYLIVEQSENLQFIFIKLRKSPFDSLSIIYSMIIFCFVLLFYRIIRFWKTKAVRIFLLMNQFISLMYSTMWKYNILLNFSANLSAC